MPQRIEFEKNLKELVETLQDHISTADGQWSVKGFIDVFKTVYTISSDTKIISKILEIHLFPKIMEFSIKHGYKVVLADHQNYYPDISFVKADDESIRFAVDFKTTYRSASDTAGSGITDFKMIRPGYDANTTQTFTDDFINALRVGGFAAIRFMNFT